MASPEALKLLRDLQLSDQNMVRVRARGPHSSGRAAPTPETDCGPSAKQNTHRWGDSGGDGADAGGTQRHRTAARDWFWIAQAGRRCGDTPTYTGSAYGRRTSPLVPARQRNRPCFEHPRSRRPRLCGVGMSVLGRVIQTNTGCSGLDSTGALHRRSAGRILHVRVHPTHEGVTLETRKRCACNTPMHVHAGAPRGVPTWFRTRPLASHVGCKYPACVLDATCGHYNATNSAANLRNISRP
jgi:hypothetical protein